MLGIPEFNFGFQLIEIRKELSTTMLNNREKNYFKENEISVNE